MLVLVLILKYIKKYLNKSTVVGICNKHRNISHKDEPNNNIYNNNDNDHSNHNNNHFDLIQNPLFPPYKFSFIYNILSFLQDHLHENNIIKLIIFL